MKKIGHQPINYLLALLITTNAHIQAAEYLKPSTSESANIKLENLTLTDQQGKHFYSVEIKASDTQEPHIGQKFSLINIAPVDAGVEDSTFSFENKMLVIQNMLLNQLPNYLTLSLSKADPIELTVNSLGITGPQGIPGPKGDPGLKGIDGLTTTVNDVVQVNGKITLTKANIGLGNVDNTSDINKPISTATQTALAALSVLLQKFSFASPDFTGVPTAPTATLGIRTNQIATTAFVTNSIPSNGFTHYVGELYGGGIVIFVYKSAGTEHALIVSVADVNSPATSIWGSNTAIGTSAQSFSNGLANTQAIAAPTVTSAAQACKQYKEGGFADWYLPSINELNILYNQAYVVDTILRDDNNPATYGLRTNLSGYWSSTEYTGGNEAWYKNFSDGTQIHTPKSQSLAVRAFRTI